VAPPLAQPVFDQLLAGQLVLHQHLGRDFNRLHLAVVLFKHPLQDLAGGGDAGVGGVPQPAHQLAGRIWNNCTAATR